MTRFIAQDRRDRYLNDWLADYDHTPRFFLHALTFLPAAFRLRAPFEVRPEDAVHVQLLDRFLLLQSKVIWGIASFLFVTYLLTLLILGGWTGDSLRWLASAAIFLVYAGGLIRTGLGVDLPWLRMTRLGSFLQLVLVFGALVVLVHHPEQFIGKLSLLSIFTLWTWTGYWGMHRPLKKRGFLSKTL